MPAPPLSHFDPFLRIRGQNRILRRPRRCGRSIIINAGDSDMKRAGVILLAVVVLGGLGTGLARAQAASDTAPTLINKGRITFTDATMVRFTDGRLDRQAVTYLPLRAKESETAALDRVLRVERQSGNSGPAYALAGALCCALGASLGVNQNSGGIEPSSETKTAVVAGMTAMGAIVGYILGAGQKHYKPAYESPALDRTGAAPAPAAAPALELCLIGGTVRF